MATPAAASAEAKKPAGLAAVLRSSGPIVTGVLLDMGPTETVGNNKEESTKEAAATNDDTRNVLSHLIREIQVDTTPSNNGAAAALGGGPITFLGQFPDEGCVVMARRESTEPAEVTDYRSCSLSQLREHCKERQVNMTGMVEKQDLVDALEQHSGTDVNPHIPLPPPLHKVRDVRGPILLLRVAATDEEEPMLENDDDEDEAATLERAVAEFERASAVSNDEFFLNYSKDEYVKFASRTDHVIPSSSEEEEDDDEEAEEGGSDEGDGKDDEEDSDDDEDFDPSEASEDEKRLLMNFIFSEVLEQFREQNGRGPDSDEVLELRKSVAQKLGMELPDPLPPTEPKKRPADAASGKATKRVKFDGSVLEKDDEEEQQPGKDGDSAEQADGEDDRKQPGTQEAKEAGGPSTE